MSEINGQQMQKILEWSAWYFGSSYLKLEAENKHIRKCLETKSDALENILKVFHIRSAEIENLKSQTTRLVVCLELLEDSLSRKQSLNDRVFCLDEIRKVLKQMKEA